MATGDAPDILSRLQRLIPNGWFPVGAAPIKDAMLAGAANAFAFIFSLLAYVRLQTRIATATDGFLDLIAFDFFGNGFHRGTGQTDGSFRNQIISFLFKQRNTRIAVTKVIQQLLGTTPVILEPQWANQAGAYGIYTTAYGVTPYGSMSMPHEIFVTVTIPESLSIAPPFVAGYDIPVGAYDTGSQIEFIGSPAIDPVQAADVYAALASVMPVTGIAWTTIAVITPPPPPPPPPPPGSGPTMDSTGFTIDESLVTIDTT